MEVWFRVLLVCWLLLQTMYLPHLANHCLGTQALSFSSLLPLSGYNCSARDDSSALRAVLHLPEAGPEEPLAMVLAAGAWR